METGFPQLKLFGKSDPIHLNHFLSAHPVQIGHHSLSFLKLQSELNLKDRFWRHQSAVKRSSLPFDPCGCWRVKRNYGRTFMRLTRVMQREVYFCSPACCETCKGIDQRYGLRRLLVPQVGHSGSLSAFIFILFGFFHQLPYLRGLLRFASQHKSVHCTKKICFRSLYFYFWKQSIVTSIQVWRIWWIFNQFKAGSYNDGRATGYVTMIQGGTITTLHIWREFVKNMFPQDQN